MIGRGLLSLAVLVTLGLFATPAWADDDTAAKLLEDGADPDHLPTGSEALRRDPRASAEARKVARELLRASRFAEAKVEVDRAVILADTAAERAAIAELAFILEEWAMRGSPKRKSHCDVPHGPSWEKTVADARAALLRGCFAAAEEAFDELFATAPDLVAAARVAELRSIARESEMEVLRPKSRDAPPTMEPGLAGEDGKRPRRWYGWQTLILDGVALGLTPINPFVGAGMYLIGAPVVHAFHQRFLVGIGDLALRFAAPLVGASLPYLVSSAGKNGRCNDECEVMTATGAILGIITAVSIDAAAIAREDMPRPAAATLTVRPFAAPSPRGFDVGLGGTF